jgi:hypothetical protein
METIMLVAGQPDLLPVFRAALAVTFPAAQISEPGGQAEFVVALAGQTRLYVEYAGTDLEQIGWEDLEIEFITQLLPSSRHVYSIAYHDIKAVKAAILSLADSPRMIVDNDFGTLLSGVDFVQKVLAEPDWNWYRDLRE